MKRGATDRITLPISDMPVSSLVSVTLHRLYSPNSIGVLKEVDQEKSVNPVDHASDGVFADTFRNADGLQLRKASGNLGQTWGQRLKSRLILSLHLRAEVRSRLGGVPGRQRVRE